MPKPRIKLIYMIFIAFSVFHEATSEKPVIIKRPSTKNVYLNKSTTFVCRVQSSLPFVIEWRKNGGQPLQNVSGFVLVFNDTLTILHARSSDSGIYECTARNSVGSSSAQATLKVSDPPVKPTITDISTNQTIVEGERVTFTCKATGNPPPQITWKIFLESGDNSAAQLERPSPQSIRLSSASPRDAGQYMCIAENNAGNDTKIIYLNVLGYPVFIVSPASNITIHENATVKLNCKVIGSPTPDVTWYYETKPADETSNVVVLRNNTLLISDVKFSNSGSYTCKANNSAGLQRSRNSLLQVKRKPRLDCCPYQSTVRQNQTATEGKSVSLYCSAAGYPKPEYQWKFKNKTVSSFSILKFSNVSRRNEGVYLCMVHNNLGEVMLMIHLNILVPPKVSVQPREATVAQGEHVVFSCTVTGIPSPSVTWYSSRGVILRNNTLMITNVSTNDQGEYTCEAKNEAGQKTVGVRLIVAVRPAFLIFPRNISVNETSSVNIQCAARGPNQPIISWYRLMTNGQKMKLKYSGDEIAITNVNRSDGGNYVCEARNYAGYINTTIFINVQYPPYVLTYEQKDNIVAGKQAILHCPVKANPAAEVQWITPAQFVGPYLTITNVNISHGGRYSCKGRNFLGTANAFLQVQVMTPPCIVDLKRHKLQSDFVSLSCVTTETPKSVVDWIDLTPLPAGSFSVHNGNLQIGKIYLSSMKFLCNASNIYGWMTKYVVVPSSPYNFTISKISATSVQFSWLHNDSEVTSSFIAERRSTSDWVTVNSSVVSTWFDDQNLTPFTEFVYRVSAKNVLGLSNPGRSFHIRTKEGVPSPPTKLEAKSSTLTSITVYWEPPEEPRGQITNITYEIYYKESTSKPENEKYIVVKDRVFEIQKLKSNTLYIIRIRAGRQADGLLQWSNYEWIREPIRTLQIAPKTAPEEIKVMSNGPRRIYVTWKRSPTYVEGYTLQYKEYESTNMPAKIVIKSWNTSSHVITGLVANRYYEVQLNMFTTGGHGPWSYPMVVHTEIDRLGLPGPMTSSSDSLPWKIAVGASAFAVLLLLLILVYIYLMKKSNHKKRSDSNEKRKKNRKQGGYDFSDNMSRVSNESEGSTEGVYNVNIQNDHIDLSMFDNSLHTNVVPEHMYVENPILPTHHDDSDDSYEAVRLATFITRPSPHPTPDLTGRRQFSSSHMNPAYYQDEDEDIIDMYSNVDHATTTKSEQFDEDGDIPVYAQVDLAKRERDRKNQDSSRLEQLSDDILI